MTISYKEHKKNGKLILEVVSKKKNLSDTLTKASEHIYKNFGDFQVFEEDEETKQMTIKRWEFFTDDEKLDIIEKAFKQMLFSWASEGYKKDEIDKKMIDIELAIQEKYKL